MATFKEKMKGRRQSKNVEDIRSKQKKEKAQREKDLMDIWTPHSKTLRSKDIKRAKDSNTDLVNTISASDGTRGSRLANKAHKDPKPSKFKK